eukprot:1840494-Amphidinium_carterae.1
MAHVQLVMMKMRLYSVYTTFATKDTGLSPSDYGLIPKQDIAALVDPLWRELLSVTCHLKAFGESS